MTTRKPNAAAAIAAAAAAAAVTVIAISPARAVTSISLDFNGSGNTLAATGFDAAYNLNTASFSVGGGVLQMNTIPGDTFGNYGGPTDPGGTDPDTAVNMFYSVLEPGQRTVVESRINVSNLNRNYHGGGIWMGTDQDHYVRLAMFHNSDLDPVNGVAVESLRENQDFWPDNVPPGPGNDIQSVSVGGIAPSPQTTPLDVVFRLVRDGTGNSVTGAGASMFYSLDNGATFNRVGGPGFTYDGIVTAAGQGPNGGPSIEAPGNFKVGVYVAGPANQIVQATFKWDNFTAQSGDTAWAADANGNWETWTAWTLGVPSAVEATANFGPVATNKTVTITDPNGHNVGSVNFNTAAGTGYTIAAGPGGTTAFNNGLRLVRFTGSASMNVTSGNHTISAPITYASNTIWNVAAAGSTLRLTGASTFETGATLTKTGPGTVEAKQVLAGGLTVSAGTVRVATNGTSASTSNVATISTSGGRFDLTNNALVVNYNAPDPSPFNDVRSQIVSAYVNGAWTGNGITSSNANNTTHGIGYAERSALSSVPTIFGTVDTDAVLVRYTRYGDADLNGTVNLIDFNALAANFNGTNKVWTQGDFNYDGNVNLLDFNRLAGNFNQVAAGETDPTPTDWANLAAAVPEPSSGVTFILGIATATVARRRRCITGYCEE